MRLGKELVKHVPLVVAPSPVRIKEIGRTRRTVNGDRSSTSLVFLKKKSERRIVGGWVTGERSRTAHGLGFRVWPIERDLCGKGDGSVGHIVTDQRIDRHQKRHLNVALVLQSAIALPRNISVHFLLWITWGPIAPSTPSILFMKPSPHFSTCILADF